MGKITWNDRTNTGADSRISASIFNDIKDSVNAIYEDDVPISGSILISGSIIPNTTGAETTSSFNLGSETAAWKELYVSTASINFVSPDGTITKWSKQDVVDLKAGKSLRKTDGKQIVHESDDSTFVQMKSSAPGRVIHKVSNTSLLDMTTGSFKVGEGRTPLTFTGAQINLNASKTALTGSFSTKGSSVFTGSVNISGSTSVSGSFTVTGSGNFFGMTVQEVLDVLAGANIGGDTSISGSTNVTGSLVITGSSTLSGSIDLEGVTTTYDLLNAIAGFEATGSINVSGSQISTGSVNHQGSTNTLPPPMVASLPPIVDTLIYGYDFNGGTDPTPPSMKVHTNNVTPTASGSGDGYRLLYDPNDIGFFIFSTASQTEFGNLTPNPAADAFLTNVSASASNDQFATIEWTPEFDPHPLTNTHRYNYQVTDVNDLGDRFRMNVSFVDSSSGDFSFPTPSKIVAFTSGSDSRFKFTIPLPPEDEPVGGWAAGDLLNLLSAFGQTDVPVGSIGDFNFDGSVNVSDLMVVLGGFGNSNVLCEDVLIPQGSNHQFVGPVISICDGNFYIIAEGSFSGITP